MRITTCSSRTKWTQFLTFLFLFHSQNVCSHMVGQAEILGIKRTFSFYLETGEWRKIGVGGLMQKEWFQCFPFSATARWIHLLISPRRTFKDKKQGFLGQGKNSLDMDSFQPHPLVDWSLKLNHHLHWFYQNPVKLQLYHPNLLHLRLKRPYKWRCMFLESRTNILLVVWECVRGKSAPFTGDQVVGSPTHSHTWILNAIASQANTRGGQGSQILDLDFLPNRAELWPFLGEVTVYPLTQQRPTGPSML